MFEEGQLYSPVSEEDGEVTVHLAHDHPGANDPGYRRRRNEIAAAALAWRPGRPSPRIDYTPANPVQQQVKPQEEPEQKDAEVALPKEEQKPEPTPPTPQVLPQEEQEAKAPPKVAPEVVRKWQITVNTRLNQYKRYPRQARARGHQGTVKVAFVLDYAGHVVSSRIVTSSGSPILDQETLDLLQRAQPFPVPPGGADDKDLFLEVPISYALR